MDSCWTCGNPFHSYENCPEEETRRKERVPETYDHRSRKRYTKNLTLSVDIYIGMKDYTMYRGEYDDQHYHPAYESPSFFNQPQRSTQQYYYQGQKQVINHTVSSEPKKYDKLMSMIESNEEANRRYEASFAAHDASFASLETHVDRLLDQLNRDETYEPQGITMLDFDDEDEEQYPNEVEAEVTHIHLNPPQLPRVEINQVGEDDSVFENKKEQEKVSLVKDEHHVV
ncbi:hypothetical protein Tco_0038454 [Tanacetum coccineum]